MEGDDGAEEEEWVFEDSDDEKETDMDICIRVLQTAAQDATKFCKDRLYRDLRKAVWPLATAMTGKTYDGMNAETFKENMAARKYQAGRKAAERAMDERAINRSKLRAARIHHLEKLMEDGTQNMAITEGIPEDIKKELTTLVPDGASFAVTNRSWADFYAEGATADVSSDPNTDARAITAGEADEGESNSNDEDKIAADIYEKHDGLSIVEKEDTEVLLHPRCCYSCKRPFFKLHFFYDQMCPTCGPFNWQKRNQMCDLSGRVALVTGGRVKIGFQIVLKLLRCGARVVVTSRFPVDAARRFEMQEDFPQWKGRLHCYGLDFRHLPSIEAFTAHLCQTFPRLDVIINNACQTIRRPASLYSHLLKAEQANTTEFSTDLQGVLENHTKLCKRFAEKNTSIANGGVSEPVVRVPPAKTAYVAPSALLSQMLVHADDYQEPQSGPKQFDVNGTVVDRRSTNSWLLELGDVTTPELTEVFTINTLAPFVLNSKLKPLMTREIAIADNKFIVNVSAMEGKFYRTKTAKHPHTNMAKAALNMLTRTSASDYKESNIYMTSVDTGWINDENPLEKASRIAESHNFQTPIDEIDAAARVLDPVIMGTNGGKLYSGVFLKDYKTTEW